jgi:hypothetical protein
MLSSAAMRRLAVLLLVVFCAAPAWAEPPSGFLEFAWGTSPSTIREQFVPKRCRTSSESRAAWLSLECRNYLVEGLSIPVLRLDFEPGDSLAGYYMIVARGNYRAFRDLMIQRFGRPTTRSSAFFQGTQMLWQWPGVSAVLLERCGQDYSCVEVKTAALDRRLEQIREREQRDSRQSF